MQHHQIPKYEPEVIERHRKNLGSRLAHTASTTTLSRIIVRGITIVSPFRIAEEIEAMMAMAMWVSADLAASVTSIVADRYTPQQYHVTIGDRPETVELITDQIEQACLRAQNGHRGLFIWNTCGEHFYIPARKPVEYPVPF